MGKLETFNTIKSKVLYYLFFVVFIAGGIICILAFHLSRAGTADWIKVNSTIVKIQNENVDVSYFVENLQSLLTGTLNEYNSTWHVGDTVPIKYNPNNPYQIASDTATSVILPYVAGAIFIGIGVIGIVVRAIKEVKGISRNKVGMVVNGEVLPTQHLYSDVIDPTEDDSKYVTLNKVVASATAVSIDSTPIEETQNFVFYAKNKRGTQFGVKTDSGEDIYLCSKEDYNLFKGNLMSFKNLYSGNSTLYRVGNTMTQSTSYINPMGLCNFYFKVDKKPVWDYLIEKGIKITASMDDNKRSYLVYLNNSKIGKIVKNKQIDPRFASFSAVAESFNFKCEYNIEVSKEHLDEVVLCVYFLQRFRKIMY